MNGPGSAREALIAEVVGDLARMFDRAEALERSMALSRQALADAHSRLGDQLAAFEAQVTALTERAKVQAVRHIVARTDEAARRSIDQQSRAMADAARAAFDAELGATVHRLHSMLHPLVGRQRRPWERWLAHAAIAVAASSVTWVIAAWVWMR